MAILVILPVSFYSQVLILICNERLRLITFIFCKSCYMGNSYIFVNLWFVHNYLQQ